MFSQISAGASLTYVAQNLNLSNFHHAIIELVEAAPERADIAGPAEALAGLEELDLGDL